MTGGMETMKTFSTCAIFMAMALTASAGSPVKLRLASYNVQHCRGSASNRDVQTYGIPQIADAIMRERPDFIGLNEVDSKTKRTGYVDCPAELGRRTGLHATFGRAIPYQGGEYGVAVLSREKPMSVVRVPLPGREKRVMLLCEFPDFWFGTTHLDFGDYQLAAVEIIRGVIAEKAAMKPVFLSGDWNAEPNSRTLEAIRGFMTVISDEHSCTFHGRKDYPPAKKYCIDYIAVDSAHAACCSVAESYVVKDISASDHNLVSVEVKLERRRGVAAVENPVWKKSFPDPTIWKAPDGSYRATSTALTILKSDDFLKWKATGKRVFTRDDERRIRREWKNIWAPDAYKLGDEYLMYVSLITCATNSAIAVYSSKDPEGPFSGGHIITRSRDTGIHDTIDPEVVRDDRDGTLWLFFGSTGRMHRVKLAPDGKSLAPDAKYEHVAGVLDNAKTCPTRKGVFEGAYLYRRNGWWYLFASDGCYWNHTYSIAVGRARTLDGPFFDRNGRRMTDGFATTVIESKKDDESFGPGHNGEIVTIDGRDYIPFHCHVAGKTPDARPFFVTELTWDKDGWPKGSLAEKHARCDCD